jgi:hypothetical protein
MVGNGVSEFANFTLDLNYYGANGNSLGSAVRTFNFTPSDNDLSSSSDEVAGAEYRKVALNGRPLPDSKPQTASESDQQDEETFVDALTLGLRHSVTDVYETVPGSSLPLAVNRVYEEETWSNRQGLRPDERPDEPFGPGWKSNIVTTARWEYDYNTDDNNDLSSNISHVYVTDENGNEYHFLAVWNAIDNLYNFIPYPTGKHEKNPYEATLTMPALGLNQTPADVPLTLTKKFGTAVVYEHADLDGVYNGTSTNGLIPNDRLVGGGGYKGYSYYRAILVTDRPGNHLVYSYDPNSNSTLVPENITATGASTTVSAADPAIHIQQDPSGHVTKILDSDYNPITYS